MAIFVGHHPGYCHYRYFLSDLSLFESETERDLLVDFDMRSDISGSFFAAFFFYRGFGQRSMGFIFNGQSGLAKQAHYGTA